MKIKVSGYTGAESTEELSKYAADLLSPGPADESWSINADVDDIVEREVSPLRESFGRLLDALAAKGVLSVDDVRNVLPHDYEHSGISELKDEVAAQAPFSYFGRWYR